MSDIHCHVSGPGNRDYNAGRHTIAAATTATMTLHEAGAVASGVVTLECQHVGGRFSPRVSSVLLTATEVDTVIDAGATVS